MRPIGFSTGALAYANFRRAIEMMRGKPVEAVELSALREDELIPLLDALDSLDLGRFRYISIHAPSAFTAKREALLWDRLCAQRGRRWPIVLHPDAVHSDDCWRELGDLVCIENMDKRKPEGRTLHELEKVFKRFPQATFCFDIGHARQVDPTMTEAALILKRFAAKLRQVHVSEVNTHSKHDRLSYVSEMGFREVAHLIPEHIPLILETPVAEEEIEAEITKVRPALPPIRVAA